MGLVPFWVTEKRPPCPISERPAGVVHVSYGDREKCPLVWNGVNRSMDQNFDLQVYLTLIASITSKCNLHCAGCYSRCNHATLDSEPVSQLTSEEWLRIFSEADDLGISFILFAGGEPMLRRDIIEAAGERQNILFPIFTNGTFIDDRYLTLFDHCRNLIPIMSIEGNREVTDARRGEGA